MDRYRTLLKKIGIDSKKINEMNDEDFEAFLQAVPNLQEYYLLLGFVSDTKDILKEWKKAGLKYHEQLKKIKK